MICPDCKGQKHALCRGRTWCDCQHRGDCQLCCGLQLSLVVHRSKRHANMTGNAYRILVGLDQRVREFYELPTGMGLNGQPLPLCEEKVTPSASPEPASRKRPQPAARTSRASGRAASSR